MTVHISSGLSDLCLNSKAEWNSQSIPRLAVEVKDKVLQLDHDGSKMGTRSYVAERPAAGHMRANQQTAKKAKSSSYIQPEQQQQQQQKSSTTETKGATLGWPPSTNPDSHPHPLHQNLSTPTHTHTQNLPIHTDPQIYQSLSKPPHTQTQNPPIQTDPQVDQSRIGPRPQDPCCPIPPSIHPNTPKTLKMVLLKAPTPSQTPIMPEKPLQNKKSVLKKPKICPESCPKVKTSGLGKNQLQITIKGKLYQPKTGKISKTKSKTRPKSKQIRDYEKEYQESQSQSTKDSSQDTKAESWSKWHINPAHRHPGNNQKPGSRPDDQD